MPDAWRYLDCNATAPMLPAARAALIEALDAGLANASSAHGPGRAARQAVDEARASVAALCGVAPDQVVFTSGATEALGLAVWSCAPGPVVGTALEHGALPAACRALPGRTWIVLPFSHAASLDEGLAERLTDAARTHAAAAVALVAAHNLTGLLTPVSALAEALASLPAERRPRLIVDAAQRVGRLPLTDLPHDYLILAAHKFGGPRGVGALVHAEDAPVRALFPGGGQERGRRGGTEAVPLIVAFGAAARWFLAHGEAEEVRLTALRDRLEARLVAALPGASIVAREAPRLPQTTAVTLPPAFGDAESTVRALSRVGLAVSATSACATGSHLPAPSLLALGLTPSAALRTLRLSLGHATSEADVDAAVDALQALSARLTR
jgi:cysteine desulfurase